MLSKRAGVLDRQGLCVPIRYIQSRMGGGGAQGDVESLLRLLVATEGN